MNSPKTAVTLYDLPQQKKHAEGALFGAFGHANGRAPRELLGNKPRQAIQAALTSDAFFAHHDGFRQSSKRESWKDLVNEASRRPKSLGFIEFEDGVPGLGRIVGRPPTTIWRHLNTWAQTGGRRPLVVVDELKEPGLKPRAYMIQIPLLTQWLLFTASMRAFKDSGMPNTMSWHQLRRLPGLFTAIGSPPPPHGLPLTYQDAEQLIRTARSEAAHQNRSRRRSR
jgi:hypothetical protein